MQPSFQQIVTTLANVSAQPGVIISDSKFSNSNSKFSCIISYTQGVMVHY
jgi:hypothetical protein